MLFLYIGHCSLFNGSASRFQDTDAIMSTVIEYSDQKKMPGHGGWTAVLALRLLNSLSAAKTNKSSKELWFTPCEWQHHILAHAHEKGWPYPWGSTANGSQCPRCLWDGVTPFQGGEQKRGKLLGFPCGNISTTEGIMRQIEVLNVASSVPIKGLSIRLQIMSKFPTGATGVRLEKKWVHIRLT